MMRIVLIIKILLALLLLMEKSEAAILLNQSSQQWERTWEMKPGIFRVLQNGKIGIVNKEGDILVPIQYDQVYDLDREGYVRVLQSLKIGLYHLDKGMILPAEYDQIWPFENGVAKVLKDRKVGFVKNDGSTLIPTEYNHIWPAEDGFYKVLKDGRMGLIDLDGRMVVYPGYQQIWSFEEGYARVLKDGKMGFINRQGFEIIAPVYQQVWNFENGKARALSGTEVHYVDTLGRLLDKEVEPIKLPVQESRQEQPAPGVRIGRDHVEVQRETHSKEIRVYKGTPSKRRKYFDGNLAGINLGINGYFNNNFKEQMPDGYEFMELNHSRSIEFSIYPFQKSTPLFSSNIGLVSALGLEYNNYRFSFKSLSEVPEHSIDWFPVLSETASIRKSKLTTLFLNVPLVMEFQVPDGTNNNLYLGAGVVGGMRLRSHTRTDSRDDGRKRKQKVRDDFDLKPFRYSYIVRAGYDNFGIYATYSPMSMFKENRGPELYPYTVGFSLNF
ncbi:WG repeat-containing protein [Alkalitalea saponilacus]|nr:WG repeat-containing protein [Alkalitalea saponilacus]ASB49252.1 hypothetical protein CDL62_08925 [Alkalitalea saponilacus]